MIISDLMFFIVGLRSLNNHDRVTLVFLSVTCSVLSILLVFVKLIICLLVHEFYISVRYWSFQTLQWGMKMTVIGMQVLLEVFLGTMTRIQWASLLPPYPPPCLPQPQVLQRILYHLRFLPIPLVDDGRTEWLRRPDKSQPQLPCLNRLRSSRWWA